MQHAQVIYVYTHDSVFLGEDGPTHEPIEHLTSIRAIPGMDIIRPADAAETAVAWAVALKNTTARPRSRSPAKRCRQSSGRTPRACATWKKAHTSSRTPNGKIDLILIATGSEVHIAVGAAKMLEEKGLGVRVVSFPSFALFNRQPREYKETILPPDVSNRVAVEAASPMSWYRWVGPYGLIIGLERFGVSAPAKVIAEHFGFTPQRITDRVMEYLELRKNDPGKPTIEGSPGCG